MFPKNGSTRLNLRARQKEPPHFRPTIGLEQHGLTRRATEQASSNLGEQAAVNRFANGAGHGRDPPPRLTRVTLTHATRLVSARGSLA